MVTMTRELERGLIEAGVSEDRAREIVDGLEVRLADLATKEDLQREITALRGEMDLRFDAIDRRFDDQNASLNARFDDQNANINARLDALNARLDDQQQFMLRVFTWSGGLLTALIAALIGTLIYTLVA